MVFFLKKKWDYYVGDFESTVDENPSLQTSTEVWASAIVPLFSEDVKIFNTIDQTFLYLINLKNDAVVYYHNLKFDGAFWIDFLLRYGFKNAIYFENEQPKFKKEKDLENGEVSYLYTDRGLMYQLVFKYNERIIKLVDSLKILPYSVKKLGKDFNTKHQKSVIEYKGERYAGCAITDVEKEYIKNDVLVIKECVEIMHREGHTRITIGSNCLKEYKEIFNAYIADGFRFTWKNAFPQLYDIELEFDKYGANSAGEYILKSYRGGWVYLKRGYANKVVLNGRTYDVNSEYPSNMHSDSGNYYPIGSPFFFDGEIPEKAKRKDRYYFVTFQCNFELKKGYLPFVQIKCDKRYNPRKMLTTSRIEKDGKFYDTYINYDGVLIKNIVTLTMTCTDFKRFLEFYDVTDFKILHGCWFYAEKGLFDKYIDKWMEVKENSTGARKGISKLFLNNLYGKFATGVDSSFKIFNLDQFGNVVSMSIREQDKQGGYIAIGSAITSYSRDFIIRHAQANYDNFIYADTDSIHMLDGEPNLIKCHPTKLLHWKCESKWDRALFVRAKTYIEHVTHENMEAVDTPYYLMKCAGLPERCKSLFLESCGVDTGYEFGDLLDTEKDFLKEKRKITDFKVGIRIPGKLKQKRIKGGIILRDEFFIMKK